MPLIDFLEKTQSVNIKNILLKFQNLCIKTPIINRMFYLKIKMNNNEKRRLYVFYRVVNF